jgi:hypothetical protein
MKKMNLIFLITSFVLCFSCTITNDMNSEVLNENTIVPKENKSTISYLALGDSYTIGQGVEENERFPVQLVKRLSDSDVKIGSPTIVARTGWTTDELARGIEDANLTGTYDLVTLLNWCQQSVPGKGYCRIPASIQGIIKQGSWFCKWVRKKSYCNFDTRLRCYAFRNK